MHLEGPFLSAVRRGVHDPAALLDPDPDLLDRLLELGRGRNRVVTLAPERPGGLAMVAQSVAAGVHAAVGHSDAGYDDALAAACVGDGDYRLAGFPVLVTDGVARLVDGGSIAGSTLTMDVAVRRAVQVLGLDLVDAANAASLVPAAVLGVADRFGSIAPGRAADSSSPTLI